MSIRLEPGLLGPVVGARVSVGGGVGLDVSPAGMVGTKTSDDAVIGLGLVGLDGGDVGERLAELARRRP